MSESLNLDKIQMVDLVSQYLRIKPEINESIQEVLDTAHFIKGPKVAQFERSLEAYLNVTNVISCANGTDALQIALMALDLNEGDEVIVPSFTYMATAEVIALLKLKPVMVEVDTNTFNTTAEIISKAITKKTKAIIPVHLFGQSSDMEEIMNLAEEHGLYVIEDNAQAIGAEYSFADGKTMKTGTIGHIGCTSFFPSKNLGCYGDGGAIYTNSDTLNIKIRMIANHGQSKKYHHTIIGVNSRLDAIQAAILNVKLKRLDEFSATRQKVAAKYDVSFADLKSIQTPVYQINSTHVFHQYTLRVMNGQRDKLKEYLSLRGIPSMVYYPIPLYKQEAFKTFFCQDAKHQSTEDLCASVLSLPIHTEMKDQTQDYIVNNVKNFFNTL